MPKNDEADLIERSERSEELKELCRDRLRGLQIKVKRTGGD